MQGTDYPDYARATCRLVMFLLAIGVFTISAYAQNFSKGQTFPTGSSPDGLKTADVNKDGRLDLILIVNAHSLEVHLGNGNGTFAATGLRYDTGIRWGDIGKVTEFEVADVNKNGNPDLVAVGGRHLSVLKGNGDGTFQSPQLFAGSDPGPQDNLESLGRGDFNRDGNADFATANPSANFIDIFYGNGDGTFDPVRSYASLGSSSDDPHTERPSEVEAGDFDNDGNADLTFLDSGLKVWYGNGAGEFPDKRTVAEGGEHHLKVFDISKDGKDDIVGSWIRCGSEGESCGGGVRTHIYSGNRSFQVHNRVHRAPDNSDTWAVTGVAMDDFNGDGILDLAAGIIVPSFHLPDAWIVFPRRADNAIDSATPYDLGEGGSTDPSEIISGDFNGDQRADIAVALRGKAEVVVFLHTGRDQDEETCFVEAQTSRAKICRPLNAKTVNSPVHIVAGATFNRTYNAAKVYVDGVQRHSATFAGGRNWFNASLAMGAGQHRITVRFWESNGQPVSQTINITVPGGSSSCSAPNGQVNICSPQNGSTVNSPVRVVAATGNSGNIGGNKVYVDGVSRFSGSGPRIDTSIPMSAGTHRITAKFWRSSGPPLSKSVTVTVR